MKKNRITKKEILSNVRALMEQLDIVEFENEDLTPDAVIEFCDKEIAALDAKAAKAKEKAAEKKAVGDALRDVVEQVLTNEYQTIADIAARIEGEDVTVGKVTNRLSALAAAGIAERTQLTVGEKGAKRKVSAYRLAQ